MFCWDVTHPWVGATRSHHNWGLMWIYSAELLCPCVFCQKVVKQILETHLWNHRYRLLAVQSDGWHDNLLEVETSFTEKHLDRLCWIVFVLFGSSYHTDVRPNIHYSEQLGFNEIHEGMMNSWVLLVIGQARTWYHRLWLRIIINVDITMAKDVSADVWDIFASLLLNCEEVKLCHSSSLLLVDLLI